VADLNPRQFKQLPLLSKAMIPKKMPHQMGIDEFARQPGTWWHAGQTRTVDELRSNYDTAQDRLARAEEGEPVYEPGLKGNLDYGNDNDWVEKGFHVGTIRASIDRVGHSIGSSNFHPVRIKPEAEPGEDDWSFDAGNEWTQNEHGTYYENWFEDEGAASAILRSPHDVQSHGDFVRQALNTPGRIPSGAAEYDAEKQPSIPGGTISMDELTLEKGAYTETTLPGEGAPFRNWKFGRDFRSPSQKFPSSWDRPEQQEMFTPWPSANPHQAHPDERVAWGARHPDWETQPRPSPLQRGQFGG
jgi:hypothetical protein